MFAAGGLKLHACKAFARSADPHNKASSFKPLIAISDPLGSLSMLIGGCDLGRSRLQEEGGRGAWPFFL